MNYLVNLGNETALIGTATSLAQGETSDPIIGNEAVFVAQVIHRTEASLSSDIASFRQQVSMQARGSVDSRLMEAIKGEAEVADNRYTFY